jgi:hypothetical protein
MLFAVAWHYFIECYSNVGCLAIIPWSFLVELVLTVSGCTSFIRARFSRLKPRRLSSLSSYRCQSLPSGYDCQRLIDFPSFYAWRIYTCILSVWRRSALFADMLSTVTKNTFVSAGIVSLPFPSKYIRSPGLMRWPDDILSGSIHHWNWYLAPFLTSNLSHSECYECSAFAASLASERSWITFYAPHQTWMIYTSMGAQVIADLLIALASFFVLRKPHSGYENTRTVLKKVILLTLGTCLAPTMFAVIRLLVVRRQEGPLYYLDSHDLVVCSDKVIPNLSLLSHAGERCACIYFSNCERRRGSNVLASILQLPARLAQLPQALP